MTYVQVIRHLDEQDLAKRAAIRLLDKLIELQHQQQTANVCLTGGRTAMMMYVELGRIMADSPLRPDRLELWWGDEHFVPTTHPDLQAAMTLATLARRFPIDASRTHPMPGPEGQLDPEAAAEAYAKELDDTRFDICVLSIGAEGQTGSLYRNHPAMEVTAVNVVAVADAPQPPSERISLTTSMLSSSNQVWFLASGRRKSSWVRAALSGDESLPATRINGREATVWMVDRDAAFGMPYFECSL
ncbi:MAG: 6-phosphogluconolactonase [Propionibacteriaceae bacterium]|jgi:6-phosphogluconolactonase|nr:6-phosphogluconolactonase [Propionibacteriaceae bacterium]